MTTPQKVLRPDVLAMTAYPVPSAKNMIKLDAMENPYSFPQTLQDGLLARLSTVLLNRYPDPKADALRAAVRNAMQIPDEFDILFGNGSDECIQMAMLAAKKPGTLMTLEPGFVMFKAIAAITGLDYVSVALGENFALDEPAMLAAIKQHQPTLIFIATPNNPTGNQFDLDVIDRIVRAAPGLVIIDEAYYQFSDETFLPRLKNYPNALLMRTVSKLGLAGLRLGMLIGRCEWLNEIDKVRPPYNVNALTQTAATYAMENYAAFMAQAKNIVKERGRLMEALTKIRGVSCFPSDANFILFTVPNPDATFEALRSRGILLKNTSHAHAQLKNTLRVTVGTAAENNTFLTALSESL